MFISTFVSAVFEHSSAGAFERLSQKSEEYFEVIRSGKTINIPQSKIVVGDIVSLRHGSVIPCDGIMLNGEIKADQSVLTGESRHIEKRGFMPLSGYVNSEDFKSDTDSENEIFSGCGVISGEAQILCLRVGVNTLFGSVACSLGGDKTQSPLKERLSSLAKKISFIGYIERFLLLWLTYLIYISLTQECHGQRHF